MAAAVLWMENPLVGQHPPEFSSLSHPVLKAAPLAVRRNETEREVRM